MGCEDRGWSHGERVRDGTQNGSVHCSGCQGHSEQGGDDEQTAGSESPDGRFKHRRCDLSANQVHVVCLFISLTNGHNIFGD